MTTQVTPQSSYFPFWGSSHGNQAPDTKRTALVSFPKIREVLWDSEKTGNSVTLHLTHSRNVIVRTAEKTIRLAYQHAVHAKIALYQGFFVGSVETDAEEEGIVVVLTRFDPGRDVPHGQSPVLTAKLPGDFVVPVFFSFEKGDRGQQTHGDKDFLTAFQFLDHATGSRGGVELTNSLALRIHCSCYEGSDDITLSLHQGAVVVATPVELTPINSIPVIPTALARNLAGPVNLSQIQKSHKTGFISMDQTRKLLLLLNTDPKAYSLPLVGIWVSGVNFVHSPVVYAACLKFLFSRSIQDRALSPSGGFVLLFYSLLHKHPQFYECKKGNDAHNLTFDLIGCKEQLHIYKHADSSLSSDIHFELTTARGGPSKELFMQALRKFDPNPSPSPRPSQTRPSTSEADPHIVPRPSPKPTLTKSPCITPSVPEVSLIFDNSENVTPPGKALISPLSGPRHPGPLKDLNQHPLQPKPGSHFGRRHSTAVDQENRPLNDQDRSVRQVPRRKSCGSSSPDPRTGQRGGCETSGRRDGKRRDSISKSKRSRQRGLQGSDGLADPGASMSQIQRSCLSADRASSRIPEGTEWNAESERMGDAVEVAENSQPRCYGSAPQVTNNTYPSDNSGYSPGIVPAARDHRHVDRGNYTEPLHSQTAVDMEGQARVHAQNLQPNHHAEEGARRPITSGQQPTVQRSQSVPSLYPQLPPSMNRDSTPPQPLSSQGGQSGPRQAGPTSQAPPAWHSPMDGQTGRACPGDQGGESYQQGPRRQSMSHRQEQHTGGGMSGGHGPLNQLQTQGKQQRLQHSLSSPTLGPAGMVSHGPNDPSAQHPPVQQSPPSQQHAKSMSPPSSGPCLSGPMENRQGAVASEHRNTSSQKSPIQPQMLGHQSPSHGGYQVRSPGYRGGEESQPEQHHLHPGTADERGKGDPQRTDVSGGHSLSDGGTMIQLKKQERMIEQLQEQIKYLLQMQAGSLSSGLMTPPATPPSNKGLGGFVFPTPSSSGGSSVPLPNSTRCMATSPENKLPPSVKQTATISTNTGQSLFFGNQDGMSPPMGTRNGPLEAQPPEGVYRDEHLDGPATDSSVPGSVSDSALSGDPGFHVDLQNTKDDTHSFGSSRVELTSYPDSASVKSSSDCSPAKEQRQDHVTPPRSQSANSGDVTIVPSPPMPTLVSPVLGESASTYLPRGPYQNSSRVSGQGLYNQAIPEESSDRSISDRGHTPSLLQRDQRQFYQNLLGNVEDFLQEEEEKGTRHGVGAATGSISSSSSSGEQATSSSEYETEEEEESAALNVPGKSMLFRSMMSSPDFHPHINYISLAETGLGPSDISIEADAIAMKYLSDEELAKMTSEIKGGRARDGVNPLLRNALTAGLPAYTTTGEKSMFKSRVEFSFATKEYLEKHGLEDGSKDGKKERKVKRKRKCKRKEMVEEREEGFERVFPVKGGQADEGAIAHQGQLPQQGFLEQVASSGNILNWSKLKTLPKLMSMVSSPDFHPHINYISLAETGLGPSDISIEADAIAMKYLSDEELAKMTSEIKGGRARDGVNPLLRNALTAGLPAYTTTGEKSMFKSRVEFSFATKKYLEKHGLEDNSKEGKKERKVKRKRKCKRKEMVEEREEGFERVFPVKRGQADEGALAHQGQLPQQGSLEHVASSGNILNWSKLKTLPKFL